MGQAQSSSVVTKAEWDAWKGNSTSASALPYISQTNLDTAISGISNTYVKKVDEQGLVTTEKLNIGKFGLAKTDDTHICLSYNGTVQGCINNLGVYVSGAAPV